MFYRILTRTFLIIGALTSIGIIHQRRIQFFFLFAFITYLSLHFSDSFATTGFTIPGTDKSAELTDANDLTSTLIGFAEKTLAPALAVVCAIGGVHRCAKKKNEEGIPLIIGAVGLVFIGRIMDTISKIFN